MNLVGKIIVFCLTMLLIAVAIFAWQNKALAPEMLLLVLTAFSILAIAAAIIAIAFTLQARRETAALSLLVEQAVDRLERRHDADHARLVMALATIDARAPLAQKDLTAITAMPSYEAANSHENSNLTNNVTSLAPPKGRKLAANDVNDDRSIAKIPAGKFPLSLEPIFEMPSATVRGYIAYAQVDGRDVRRPALKSHDDLAQFDYQLAFAAAKAARQLLTDDHAAPIYCSISAATLHSLGHIKLLFGAQPDLKTSLVLLVDNDCLKLLSADPIQGLLNDNIRVAIESNHLDAAVAPLNGINQWLVSAEALRRNGNSKTIELFHKVSDRDATQIIVLNSGADTQFSDLIELGITLTTSSQLSPPRLVRS